MTWDQIVDAGKETTASQKVLFVLLLVTLLFLFNVQKEKSSVTMDQVEVAGWETTVCHRVLSVHIHVTLQFHLCALKDK